MPRCMSALRILRSSRRDCAAAREGRLRTADDLRRETVRLLATPRARAQERHFLEDWLSTSRLPLTVKDEKLHPGFDDARRALFRSELDAFYDADFATGFCQ